MGNVTSNKINFEDVQFAIRNPNIYIIINTLPSNEQSCLIKNTLSYHLEEETINKYIKTNSNIFIILYGKNSNDEKIYKKYQQLITFGFKNVFIYTGGMFEWLLLQDIYGNENFQTTSNHLDILSFSPKRGLINLITNN
jgi:hypothetical protein